MKIADNAGVWLINTTQFPMYDSESNTRFEPQEPTKALLTNFVSLQPTIVRCAEPGAELNEKQQSKLEDQIAKDEADRVAREAAAEKVMLASNAETVAAAELAATSLAAATLATPLVP